MTALAQSNTCSQKKRVYPTLNVTNESDPKATIDGEIWAYGDGTMLACEGEYYLFLFAYQAVVGETATATGNSKFASQEQG